MFLDLIINPERAVKGMGRPGRIAVESRRVGDRIRIVISDNGPGIPPARRKRIFLPLSATGKTGTGAGLGLSVCHGIVEEHGGRLEADSREGEGSAFTVDLPIAAAGPARKADVSSRAR